MFDDELLDVLLCFLSEERDYVNKYMKLEIFFYLGYDEVRRVL